MKQIVICGIIGILILLGECCQFASKTNESVGQDIQYLFDEQKFVLRTDKGNKDFLSPKILLNRNDMKIRIKKENHVSVLSTAGFGYILTEDGKWRAVYIDNNNEIKYIPLDYEQYVAYNDYVDELILHETDLVIFDELEVRVEFLHLMALLRLYEVEDYLEVLDNRGYSDPLINNAEKIYRDVGKCLEYLDGID